MSPIVPIHIPASQPLTSRLNIGEAQASGDVADGIAPENEGVSGGFTDCTVEIAHNLRIGPGFVIEMPVGVGDLGAETVTSPARRVSWNMYFAQGADPGETQVREVMKAPGGELLRTALALI